MSPALNGSSAIRVRRFERSNAVEIREGITFDFYTGLPHMLSGHRLMMSFDISACFMVYREISWRITMLHGVAKGNQENLSNHRNHNNNLGNRKLRSYLRGTEEQEPGKLHVLLVHVLQYLQLGLFFVGGAEKPTLNLGHNFSKPQSDWKFQICYCCMYCYP